MEAIHLNGVLSRLVDAQYRVAEAPALMEEVLPVVLDAALSLIGGRPVVALLDGDRLVARAASGAGGPQVGDVLEVPGSVCELVLRARAPMLCRDSRQRADGDLALSSLRGVRSAVSVALRHDGATLGLLACTSPEAAAFDEQDRDRLSLLGTVTSSAVAAASSVALAAATAGGAQPLTGHRRLATSVCSPRRCT